MYSGAHIKNVSFLRRYNDKETRSYFYKLFTLVEHFADKAILSNSTSRVYLMNNGNELCFTHADRQKAVIVKFTDYFTEEMRSYRLMIGTTKNFTLYEFAKLLKDYV